MLAAPKRWDFLSAAWLTFLVAVLFTFVRWYYLVRAVGIPMSPRDTLRIGFLGYLFNLLPFGIVGGDLFKSLILAHEWPGHRAKSLASVLVDRIVGLEVLFLLASLGVFTGSLWSDPDPKAHWVVVAVLSVTVISTLGLVSCMIPGVLNAPVFKAMERLPKVGHAAHSLLESLRIYRSNFAVLLLSGVLTAPVHSLFALTFFFLACGLQFPSLTYLDFLAIYSVSGILAVIPVTAGPTEGGIIFLYALALKFANHGVAVEDAASKGLMIALASRLIQITLAMIGMAFYYFGRKEVREVIIESGEDIGDDDVPKRLGNGEPNGPGSGQLAAGI